MVTKEIGSESEAVPFPEILERADDLKQQATSLEAQFLKEAGWKYTCDTPGSRWLWSKDLGERGIVLLQAKHAIETQTDEDMR